MTTPNMPGLLLRADASTAIGAGHVMRCLALAQAWQEAGGAACFAAVELPDGLAARLAAERIALRRLHAAPGSRADAEQTAALARELGATWVVEDGYPFDADYQRNIKDAGLRLVAIDDYGHAGRYVADLVLNQNIYAAESLYPNRAPDTRLLLGTRYALLRREFSPWQAWQRTIAPIGRKILVTLGGSDPGNVTATVLEALLGVDLADLETIVVVGAGNPHLATLEARLQGRPGFQLQYHVSDMPALMAWADIAISASGSTCWELAFLGLPSLLVVLADNQAPIADRLDACGAAINLGWHASLTSGAIAGAVTQLASAPERRAHLAGQMRALVDGRGATRVLRAMTPTAELSLRPAAPPTAGWCGSGPTTPAPRRVVLLRADPLAAARRVV